jgi:RNA polymerase sigma-70 factor (ECF subfamily)
VSDGELVERARRGDREAFGELVERHQHAVFRTVLVALRSREDAEEVTQEAFISAMQKLGSFRGEASFKTWLLTIAWNRAMDRRRSVGEWLRRFVTRDEGEDWSWEPAATGPSNEDALIAAQDRREVRKLLRTLPAKYRDPLALSAGGEHTFEDIGALLGIPVGTAKWRAMQGRRLLKRKLQGRTEQAARGSGLKALGRSRIPGRGVEKGER